MRRKAFLFALGIAVLFTAIVAAAPPPGAPNPASDKIVDNVTYINPGDIFMFVTNHGNFGRDMSDVFGYQYGTFYPFETIDDISNGTLISSVLYGAGLWIGGLVDGETRVTVAEYIDEYVPGPMQDGSYLPDDPAFKVYKLYRDSLADNPNSDYLNWPADQGAPVDEMGRPAMLGDQMLWAVFNDADPNQHVNNSGETLPLGVEVQLTAWAYKNGGALPNIIYFKYKIYNEGQDIIDDCYLSLWTDPDLGGSDDDLVGCDTLDNLFYCYNADNSDTQYGNEPPAIGFKIIYGPLVPSLGQTAYFDGHPVPGFDNLGLTAFSKYINGTDPDNCTESYNYMRGLNRNGTPYTYNGHELSYWHSGDPVTGTGDLDLTPSDRRMMGSMGPFNIAPGDSQFVMAAMAVGHDMDRLSSLAELRYFMETNTDFPLPSSIDNDTYINPGNILMFVTNHGNFGRDLGGVLGYDYGTFFPYETVDDITNGTLTSSPLYAAGIWMGGLVAGEVRLATAEYADEYVPGPMQDGSYLPDDPAFKVYKLYRDSLADNPNSDYLNWPTDQGAPVDELGRPAMLGDQMLWAVFNDADPNQHVNNSGETLPLGVEVQLTAWAYKNPSMENLVFLRYKLYNKGSNDIEDFHFSLWGDPDLGGSTDDLVGCDTVNSIGFCYNADNDDAQYGSQPPAIGFKVIKGPLVPSPGDMGYFDGYYISNYKNLNLTSFAKYIGGIDPDDPIESYNYMKGLLRDGSEYIYDGHVLKYIHSGDPVTGLGDLDQYPADRRMMLNFGPFDFNPGDSQYVFLLMGIAQGPDRLASISDLKNLLNLHGQVLPKYTAIMAMDTMFAYMANAVNPIMTSLYLGNFWGDHLITDVNLSSLTLNGTIPLSNVNIGPSPIPDIAGDAITADFDARQFVQYYVPIWDIEEHPFTVEGVFDDAAPFTINGTIPMVGHISGDANGDNTVNLSDAMYLIQFRFYGGPPPAVFGTGDPNADGRINVLDIIYVIDYMLRGGPRPMHP